MLLFSASGSIKSPVGACATAVQSFEIGVNSILTEKAKISIVGGTDDFVESGSFEFANMKATSDSVKETKYGREPSEMCRPCSSTREGFMESKGSGVSLLTSAAFAVENGSSYLWNCCCNKYCDG